MSFAVGENVGAYRIIEQLGQGGMATVYKAHHAALDRYVAIKVLHPAFKEDPNFLARFQREARVVARLEHANIAPVYDFAAHNGAPYLVMKFIEGETLKAALARGPLSLGEALKIVEAVGAGLEAAHRQGILHRDIKPSNIMLAKDGSIYLADFGLARIALSGESTLSADSMLGTPHYMSPEQAKGDKDLDAGTDIYSLGVVMYELVVGRVPYSADTPFAIIHDHIYAPLPMPRGINSNVPEAVERVLLKAMAKDRADRYSDVRHLVAAFRDGVTPVILGSSAGGSVTTALPHPVPVAPASPTPPASKTAETVAGTAPSRPASGEANPRAPYRFRLWHPFVVLALTGCLCFGVLALGARGARFAAGLPAPTLPPSAGTAGRDAGTLLAEARRVFAAGQDDAALQLLDEAAHLDPGNVMIFVQAGDLALEFNHPADALRRYYLPAHDLEQQHPDDLARLALNQTGLALYVFAGDPAAEHDLTQLADSFRPREAAEAALARWYVLHNQPALARERLDNLRAAWPRFATGMLVDADYYVSAGNRVEARSLYQRVAESTADQTPGWALAEARCRLDQLRRDDSAAQLGVTCEPLSSLATGR